MVFASAGAMEGLRGLGRGDVEGGAGAGEGHEASQPPVGTQATAAPMAVPAGVAGAEGWRAAELATTA